MYTTQGGGYYLYGSRIYEKIISVRVGPDIRWPNIIRLDIRDPANPPDIRYPAILPDYPVGYLIILNKSLRFTHSVNFRFVPHILLD